MALSAMNSLLCMRFWMRGTSFSDVMTRPINEAREPGRGLNNRISTLGSNARRSTWASFPAVLKSSSSIRTRTPRRAASRSACSRISVLASAWMA